MSEGEIDDLEAEEVESDQYLVFTTQLQEFGFQAMGVQEITSVLGTTEVPNTPPYIEGIINLRGQVVPVVDLRLKFSMGETVKTEHTCVIVLDIGTGENRTVIGALADSVKDVFEFDSGQVEPPPRIGTLSQVDFIQGIGKRDQDFIIILNINRTRFAG